MYGEMGSIIPSEICQEEYENSREITNKEKWFLSREASLQGCKLAYIFVY